MIQEDHLNLLFIINPNSGHNTIDWTQAIEDYFVSSNHTIKIHQLTKGCSIQTILDKIKLFSPDQVVAVGGDGTVKLVAECLIQQNIVLGILPAGSANGLAKELGISNDPVKALDTLVQGHSKKIHATRINKHLCIHLSDIGLNAYAIKRFERQRVRGMWGYVIASLKVLWQNPRMDIEMRVDQKVIHINAEMIVIANATKYGCGAVINPIGQLDDELFEVIAIKQVSFIEIFKMIFLHTAFNPEKTALFQTSALMMRSAKSIHFQVDGEYLGKVKEVKAVILPDALEVIVPEVTS